MCCCSDEARASNPTSGKEPMVAYERTQLRKRKIAYHLMDKPPPRGHPDWKRVVAVIVQVRAPGWGHRLGKV
jgi:hypothetical protein